MKFNQEDILRFIQSRNWKNVLDFLHSNKAEIQTDQLLQFASNIFESEFFFALERNSDNIEFNDLEKLFLLHNGKFFVLQNSHYEQLVSELALQSSGESAYNYAQLFPKNESCKQIIAKYKASKRTSKISINSMDWIEIYNRLFEIVNNQYDQSTYFSGPRFINTLREFDQYHPDYNQYIQLRNRQGKSTSRRIFYYDILMELEKQKRIDFVKRILEMVEPFDQERVIPIRALLNGEKQDIRTRKLKEISPDTSTVFISYSWDDENHKKWVLELANKLVKEGVNVILDRYELRPGKSLPHFVENSIKKANRIVIVFTPNYKLKAEKREGGVGFEYSIMNSELYKNQTNNERIIPILRRGESNDSIPEFMQQYIHIDMKNDENFENSYTDLLREIYDQPAVLKPELGEKRKLFGI